MTKKNIYFFYNSNWKPIPSKNKRKITSWRVLCHDMESISETWRQKWKYSDKGETKASWTWKKCAESKRKLKCFVNSRPYDKEISYMILLPAVAAFKKCLYWISALCVLGSTRKNFSRSFSILMFPRNSTALFAKICFCAAISILLC